MKPKIRVTPEGQQIRRTHVTLSRDCYDKVNTKAIKAKRTVASHMAFVLEEHANEGDGPGEDFKPGGTD